MRPMFLLVAITACTSPAPERFDDPPAPVRPPAMAKGFPATSALAQLPCDYSEAQDATNDYRMASGYAVEATALAYSGAEKTICGNVNNGHFDTGDYAVDIDNYGIHVSSESDVVVWLTGPLTDVSTVSVWAYSPATETVVGGGYFLGDHAIFSAHLVAGDYEISVEAYDNADKSQSYAYQLTMAGDTPASRCAAKGGAADYTESHDGTYNTGNDIVDIDFSLWPMESLTPSTTDQAESVTTAFASGASYRLDGTAGAATAVGSYLDHDTYAILTGSTTTQLSVRLGWSDAAADLDYYLMAQGSTFPFAQSAIAGTSGEFATFSVQPNWRYWLWVGAYAGTTSYQATICAETFTVGE